MKVPSCELALQNLVTIVLHIIPDVIIRYRHRFTTTKVNSHYTVVNASKLEAEFLPNPSSPETARDRVFAGTESESSAPFDVRNQSLLASVQHGIEYSTYRLASW